MRQQADSDPFGLGLTNLQQKLFELEWAFINAGAGS